MNDITMARGLGLFSLGIGLTELLAPKWLGEQAGIGKKKERLLRGFGAREVAAGVGVLAQDPPTKALWSRVAGDALDLGVLARSIRKNRRWKRVAVALAMVAGVTALDVFVAWRLQR